MAQGPRLGEILIGAKLLDPTGLDRALAHARSTRQPLGSALIELGLVTADNVARGLAKQCGVPAATEAHFAGIAGQPGLVKVVPVALARKGLLVPLAVLPSGEVVVAIADPRDLGELDNLAFAIGRRVKPAIASLKRIKAAIDLLYGADLNEPDPLLRKPRR